MRKTWCVLIIVIPDEGVHIRLLDKKIKVEKIGAIVIVVQKREKRKGSSVPKFTTSHHVIRSITQVPIRSSGSTPREDIHEDQIHH